MSLWSKIRGTAETIFQLGLGGPQLKNNSSVLEARNAGDSGFVVMRGATPVADNDLVTKQYADTLNKPIVVTAQFDGNNALPTNTGSEHFIVVSTTGPNATIGQVLWDDGLAVGTVAVLSALDGRSIYTSIAFAGGTVTFRAQAYYVWVAANTAWSLESSASLAGAVREIRYAITNANGAQDSATQIPAGAQVISAEVNITTPYSGGATISVGQAGGVSLLQLVGDNSPQAVGIYQVMEDTAWGGSPLAIRTTIAGAPAAGAGFTSVRYVVADA